MNDPEEFMEKYVKFLFAGALLLSALLTSCRKDGTSEILAGNSAAQESVSGISAAVSAGEPVTRTTHLTGIFKPEALAAPDNITYRRTYCPEFDENGNLTVFAYSSEDGEKRYAMLTVSPEGEILNRMEVDYDRGYNIDRITTANNTVYYTQRRDGGAVNYLFASGEHGAETPVKLNDIFAATDMYGFNVETIAADREGNLYLCTAQEAAVFSPDLVLRFVLRPEGGITAMAADGDGTVWLASGTGKSYGLYPVDVSTKSLGAPHLLGNLRIENLFFGGGYDFYHTDHATAVYGVNYPAEDGAEPEITVVMNYLNSGVEHTTFTLLNVRDEQTLIAAEVSPVSNQERAPVLYRKAPDRDLSEITVIEVAYTDADYYFEADVMNFNKKHDDIMVVLQDYSRFSNETEPEAGEKRLAMDVVTGIYQPDILLGTYDHPFVKSAVDQGNYVDLLPYIENDAKVNTENVFPSILYSYSAKDNRVWGLPLSFEVRTLVANNAVTGGKTSWNFREMMNFIGTLPQNVRILQGLTRSNVLENLLGSNAFASFIDMENGTCDFSNEEFVQLLEFMKTLPQEMRTGTEEEEYLARHEGNVALFRHTISELENWLSLGAVYSSDDYTLIGYPTEKASEKGAQLVFAESYTILSTSENPDAAWEFISFMLGDKSVYTHSSFGYTRGIPVMRNQLEKINETALKTVYDFRFGMNGHSTMTFSNGEIPDDLSAPREPSVRVIPTQDDLDAFCRFLADDIGGRIIDRIPDELNAIVNEEISAYLGGVKDASACAHVIESRVRLWLAEHS